MNFAGLLTEAELQADQAKQWTESPPTFLISSFTSCLTCRTCVKICPKRATCYLGPNKDFFFLCKYSFLFFSEKKKENNYKISNL